MLKPDQKRTRDVEKLYVVFRNKIYKIEMEKKKKLLKLRNLEEIKNWDKRADWK